MNKVAFISVADAIRSNQNAFDVALSESVTSTVMQSSVNDLRQAFFNYQSAKDDDIQFSARRTQAA